MRTKGWGTGCVKWVLGIPTGPHGDLPSAVPSQPGSPLGEVGLWLPQASWSGCCGVPGAPRGSFLSSPFPPGGTKQGLGQCTALGEAESPDRELIPFEARTPPPGWPFATHEHNTSSVLCHVKGHRMHGRELAGLQSLRAGWSVSFDLLSVLKPKRGSAPSGCSTVGDPGRGPPDPC